MKNNNKLFEFENSKHSPNNGRLISNVKKMEKKIKLKFSLFTMDCVCWYFVFLSFSSLSFFFSQLLDFFSFFPNEISLVNSFVCKSIDETDKNPCIQRNDSFVIRIGHTFQMIKNKRQKYVHIYLFEISPNSRMRSVWPKCASVQYKYAQCKV